MNPAALQTRIGRAGGIAARRLGVPHDLYRPKTAYQPLAIANRILRLPASFTPKDMHYRTPLNYGPGLYYGLFDSTVTAAGDYLGGPAGTWFITAQQPLLPILCVLTNCTVTLGRPAAPNAAGTNSYGGVTLGAATVLGTGWPASVTSSGGGQEGALPSDATVPYWSVLLPTLPFALRSADLVTDDLGRTFVVAVAEPSALGWRLTVAEAAT